MRILKHGEEKDIDVISVTLVRSESPYDIKMFYCINCGSPVFQYAGRVVDIVPWFVPSETLVITQCTHKWNDTTVCHKKYLARIISPRE